MTIKEHIEKLKAERGDKSFAFLAERCETSDDNPYRIRPAAPLQPDEVAVVMLCGAGTRGVDHIREYNGYLKQVDEFIKNSPKLRHKKTRVVVAICNFGKYHDPKVARHLQHMEYVDYESFRKEISKLSAEEREEILNPVYIQDIFNQTVLPRLSTDGKHPHSLRRTLGFVRKVNFVTHCHGGYVALSLEKMLNKKMTSLGFNGDEQSQIVSQFLSLNYAPDSAKHSAESTFITFQSAQDNHIKDKTFFEEWLLMKRKDFGLSFLPKNGNVFTCAQVDKSGIEGNPPRVWIAKEIGDFFDERANAIKEANKNDWQDPEEEKIAGEHSFLGFKPKSNMSKGALKMQSLANNILENAVVNSHQQSLYNPVPLPSIQSLAANNSDERMDLAKAKLKGYKLNLECAFASDNKVIQYKTWRVNHTIEI